MGINVPLVLVKFPAIITRADALLTLNVDVVVLILSVRPEEIVLVVEAPVKSIVRLVPMVIFPDAKLIPAVVPVPFIVNVVFAAIPVKVTVPE